MKVICMSKVEAMALKVVKLDSNIKNANSRITALKLELMKQMKLSKKKSIIVKLPQDESEVNVKQEKTLTIAERMDLSFDLDKLKEKLSKEDFEEVSVRVVSIPDIDKFKKLMKKYDVPFKELKPVLNVTESVSNFRINEMYKTGDLQLKEIEGAYSVKFSEYITIR